MKPNDRIVCTKAKESDLSKGCVYTIAETSVRLVRLTCGPLWYSKGRFELKEDKDEQV